MLTAADGEEAVHLYRTHSHDLALILLDFTVPGMSGLNTFSALQSAGCEVPVVLAGGYSEAQLRKEYGEKGFAGFLHKPFQKKTLRDMLAQVFTEG